MGIEFHDPRGESRVAADPYLPRAELSGASRVGLLANNFPDSIAFLDAIEAALAERLPGAAFTRYEKPGASVPADETLVASIAAECDALVTAYGH